ncbi:hypothetical protein ACVILH_004261 [Bradyrhizobium sp. USDA 4353]
MSHCSSGLHIASNVIHAGATWRADPFRPERSEAAYFSGIIDECRWSIFQAPSS